MTVRPTLRTERGLSRRGSTAIACIDEVGRGALAGPVTVGVVISSLDARPPRGVRDSKELSAQARRNVMPLIQQWARAWSVGHASAAEIDARGIIAALRLAAVRALEQLTVAPDVIVLDGSHDFLTPAAQVSLVEDEPADPMPPVLMVVGGDRRCVGVACASIVAKCARDAVMEDLAIEHPQFEWQRNKGYGTREHLVAIAEHGPCDEHRRTWRLTGRTV